MKQNFTVRKGALDGVEAFLSVARHRNFRKAAAELGVTPSAMSQAVRTLEARVGAAFAEPLKAAAAEPSGAGPEPTSRVDSAMPEVTHPVGADT